MGRLRPGGPIDGIVLVQAVLAVAAFQVRRQHVRRRMVAVRRNFSIGVHGEQLVAVDGRKTAAHSLRPTMQLQFTASGNHDLRLAAAPDPAPRHPLHLVPVQPDRRRGRQGHTRLTRPETRRQQLIEQTLANAVPRRRRAIEHRGKSSVCLPAVGEHAPESEAPAAVVQQPHRCTAVEAFAAHDTEPVVTAQAETMHLVPKVRLEQLLRTGSTATEQEAKILRHVGGTGPDASRHHQRRHRRYLRMAFLGSQCPPLACG